MEIITLPSDIVAPSDTLKATKNKDWYKRIKKDAYIMEAISVIGDM